MSDNKMLLIDGSSMLVRAFFATSFGKTLRQTADGTYTNAVFGFLNMLFSALETFKPTYLLVAWDVSRDTFRRELYPKYKGTRGELPPEMLTQFDTMQSVLTGLGIHQCWDDRYEADDFLGTAALAASREGIRVDILTGDRDALQLVSEFVSVCIMRKGISELDIYTPESLEAAWNLRSDQIIDLKALMGDSSDNIPGVPGVGEKTAKRLLLQFDNLETIYNRIDEIPGKLKIRLEQNRDLAFLSKKLATIVCDAPLPTPVSECHLKLDAQGAENAFKRLEFHRIQERFERLQQVLDA